MLLYVNFAIRFQEAGKVVNGIPVDKFPLLLNRIIQKLHLKVSNLLTCCLSYEIFYKHHRFLRLRFSVLRKKNS